MTNSIGDQTPNERKEVFDDYLMYYDQVWQHGNVKVCKDRQVTEKARHVLLSETDPVERFTTFDFYHTAFECVRLGVKDCRSVFNVFIKAAELLETLCVNLFLFPWKKEIKTIKTFTGPFVYCIQPVFPKNIVSGILESIGYRPESDTEYRLTADADHDQAKAMGFELFLARVECEYLLEIMGQRAHAECLEIFQRRAGPLNHWESRGTAENEPRNESSRAVKDSGSLEVDAVDQPDVFSLAEPSVVAQEQEEQPEGSVRPTEEPERHAPLPLDAEGSGAAAGPESSGRHRTGSSMLDDRSMIEMQTNYPDLAIRKNPVFRKNRGGSYPTPGTKVRGRLGDDGDIMPMRNYAHTHASDLSSPQSFSLHTESQVAAASSAPIKPQPKPSLPEVILEPQPLMVSSGPASMIQYRDTAVQSAVSRPGQEGTPINTLDLEELSNRLRQLCVEELKYPIEETAQGQSPCTGCHDHHRPAAAATAPPPGSPRDNSHQPILCTPSPLPVCSITGCNSHPGLHVVHHGLQLGEDTIKEPPSSFYKPPSPLGMCGPPLEPPAGHLGMCGPPVEPPVGHLPATVAAAAAPAPLGAAGVEGRASGQQPEDDILQTYVLVEHERK
ncbi:uncharacterized protein LOC121682134 [Alosa sapidissima]|uniref:uncharacterized protein LOC121682134 n=1 Tax=Alosa sapidissima TaxID=34773 RepID=UPI001C08DCAE|nr:uncharacterized protein LOC121682134 [Alosa sapidissima]